MMTHRFGTLLIILASFVTLSFCTIVRRSPSIEEIESKMEMEKAQADFALNLLRESTKDGQPAILSPFSIAVALSMTYAGAEGNTEEEMRNVLAKGLNAEQIHEYFKGLLSDISTKNAKYTLESANRLYVQQNFVLKLAYLKTIGENYAGELESVNFGESTEVAKKINEWVERKTHDKIKDLVSADNFSGLTRLVLVNAIYFKGEWEVKFEKRLTKTKPFYVDENTEKKVEMMSKKANFAYNEDDDVQMLGIPYKGMEAFLYVFLPKKKFGLAAVEKKLNGEKMMELVRQSDNREVQVEIPKFKLEEKLGLVSVLTKLGMNDAFSQNANFSGMSDDPLYISDVIHKAFIEVNEEGAEAAAATAVIMARMSAPIRRSEIKIVLDHPFIFTIVKDRTVLFIGRYN